MVLNENEPLLLQDMAAMLERISGAAGIYEHNDMSRRSGEMEPNECANGHAHCQHLLVGGSQTIPVWDGAPGSSAAGSESSCWNSIGHASARSLSRPSAPDASRNLSA